jgi:glyoxylase-like metal-dependent hydrolase (beta-lactamase superfamily II)
MAAASALAFAPRFVRAQDNAPPASVRQVAPDLYFFFDYAGSNSVFLTSDNGVLVIDTRQHPRAAEELIAEIRKVSSAPIRWVINSHFHGDHTFGNAAFEKQGATFVAQAATPPIMQKVHPKEMARRQEYFRSHNYDPNEVKLILPSITFDKEMSLWLGTPDPNIAMSAEARKAQADLVAVARSVRPTQVSQKEIPPQREARLMYLGPGQQDGDTFVWFPHAKTLFTPGSFATRNIPNMAFTTSVESWLQLLESIVKNTDVERILPAHGDLATRNDVNEFAAMLRDVYTIVKGAAEQGMPLEMAQQQLTFPQYANWRNYGRMKDEIANLYELILTHRRSYFE